MGRWSKIGARALDEVAFWRLPRKFRESQAFARETRRYVAEMKVLQRSLEGD